MSEDPALAALLQAAAGVNPAHVGLIMDGNGRWAQARGLSRPKGHEAGLEAFRRIMNGAADLGVPILTVYAFSSENWQRPADEVEAIMGLLLEYLETYRHEFLEQDCRFLVSGRQEMLSLHARQLIARAQAETAHCRSRLLNLALSYGGRQELTDAVQALASQVARGELRPEDIREEHISAQLYRPDLPDPDLIIRTSGEHRLSGFLLWQSAYSELLFHPTLWPDFTPALFQDCLTQYRSRDRRFGLV